MPACPCFVLASTDEGERRRTSITAASPLARGPLHTSCAPGGTNTADACENSQAVLGLEAEQTTTAR